MPTHKGVTITVHTPNGPLPEYKSHTRRTVTTSYIAVPSPDSPLPLIKAPGPVAPKNTFPPSAPSNSFAISISISAEDYKPLTDNPQEHLAAYLFLDGKEEEAAAMLTRRRDTWISSRWCAMDDGSIGEKAFMWREVGLETFLGNLDLSREEKEAVRAATEREANSPRPGRIRKGKLTRRNTTAAASSRKSLSSSPALSANRSRTNLDSDEEVHMQDTPPRSPSPSDNDDDDEAAPPAQIKNTVGQIKLKLYRVLADGAPKYGVFEPKKDEQDSMLDDEEAVPEPGTAAKAEVSHTTGFAPAQKVDKDLIWSQTVTCLDPLSSPWATFIIFYRGERQLRKMGVITESPSLSPKWTPASPLSPGANSRKRQSMRLEDAFKNLKPLPPPSSQSGFLGFREANGNGVKKNKKGQSMDSDDEESENEMNGDNIPVSHNTRSKSGAELTEEEARVEEGIRKMKLKRTRATTPVPPTSETAQSQPDDGNSWEWYEKYSTPASNVAGGSRNGNHRRTKSAAGLLQKMVDEGTVGDNITAATVASPNKKVKRRESALDDDEALL